MPLLSAETIINRSLGRVHLHLVDSVNSLSEARRRLDEMNATKNLCRIAAALQLISSALEDVRAELTKEEEKERQYV